MELLGGGVALGPRIDWEARYRSASRALASASSMRAEVHRVCQIGENDRAALRVIAGMKALRSSEPGRMVAFSGSFNPLTTAHVGLVEAALARGYDAALWIIPAASVDKERVTRAALADRVAQMRAYLRTTRRQSLALVNRGLYYEQARLLRRRLPHAEIALLVGFDKVAQIFDARYYRDRDAALIALFQQTRLLVAPRAGAGVAELRALLARPENAPFASHVSYLPTPHELEEESSTAARVAAGAANTDELRRLVPPEAVALAATGAYASISQDASVIDPYEARLAWLRELERS